MPEGPEIRRAADRIATAIAGRRAERVRLCIDRLNPRDGELDGREVLSVRPRGKALLTRFEGGKVLYSHNQLYGRWYVCKPGRPPRTNRSLRVAIETEFAWALLYSASEIELLDEGELERHPFLAKLGPDLLDERTNPARIRRALLARPFRGRALGSLLLDQGCLAGTGNYLRSEILFFSGLTPDARPADLDGQALARVARAARAVTVRSYRTGGTTELASFARAARTRGEPRRWWRHAVFGRDGQPCRRCGTTVERVEVGSRRLYLCPGCQRGPRA